MLIHSMDESEEDWNFQGLLDYVNGNLLHEGVLTLRGSSRKRSQKK